MYCCHNKMAALETVEQITKWLPWNSRPPLWNTGDLPWMLGGFKPSIFLWGSQLIPNGFAQTCRYKGDTSWAHQKHISIQWIRGNPGLVFSIDEERLWRRNKLVPKNASASAMALVDTTLCITGLDRPLAWSSNTLLMLFECLFLSACNTKC